MQFVNTIILHIEKVHRIGLGFNGIAKMLRFLLVVIDSDYSIEVLLSSSLVKAYLNNIWCFTIHT